jgi:hypothetical protein
MRSLGVQGRTDRTYSAIHPCREQQILSARRPLSLPKAPIEPSLELFLEPSDARLATPSGWQSQRLEQSPACAEPCAAVSRFATFRRSRGLSGIGS